MGQVHLVKFLHLIKQHQVLQYHTLMLHQIVLCGKPAVIHQQQPHTSNSGGQHNESIFRNNTNSGK